MRTQINTKEREVFEPINRDGNEKKWEKTLICGWFKKKKWKSPGETQRDLTPRLYPTTVALPVGEGRDRRALHINSGWFLSVSMRPIDNRDKWIINQLSQPESRAGVSLGQYILTKKKRKWRAMKYNRKTNARTEIQWEKVYRCCAFEGCLFLGNT